MLSLCGFELYSRWVPLNFPQHMYRTKTLTSKEGWPRVIGILTQIYNGRKFVRGRVNVPKLNFLPIFNYQLYYALYLNDLFKFE